MGKLGRTQRSGKVGPTTRLHGSTTESYDRAATTTSGSVSTTAVLVWRNDARRTLNEALHLANVRFFSGADELFAAAQTQWANAIIIEPLDDANQSTAPIVRRVRNGFPSIPVIVYTGTEQSETRSLVQIIRAGGDAIAVRGVDDILGQLKHIVEVSTLTRVSSETLQQIEPELSPEVRPILAFCLENAARELSVQEVADALSVHRRTLVNRLRSAGLPGPAWIITWCRLSVASRLLDDPARSVDQVAATLHFASPSAFRALCKRHTGMRPQELRQRGAPQQMIELIRRRLRTMPDRIGGAA